MYEEKQNLLVRYVAQLVLQLKTNFHLLSCPREDARGIRMKDT